MAPKFDVGSEVQSTTDPERIGTVVEIGELHAGVQWYRVNFGPLGRPKVPEPNLRPYLPGDTPLDNLLAGRIDGYREFQRLITFQRIWREHPLRNNIYSFNASRTRFYPYQFKPLLKFLDSPKNRLLIADEVGLGKTIEACLIMTELRARQTLERILVVCPANLRDKWQLELQRRFGEEFEVFDGVRAFHRYLDRYEESPETAKLQGIISIESLRTRPVLDRLEELQPSLNLVIIDEAHHMRNFGTLTRLAGVRLGMVAETLVFLTATPIHLGSENLFSLLNILDDEDFPDSFTVEQRLRQNEPIVAAQICMGQLPPNVQGAIAQLSNARGSDWVRDNPLLDEIDWKLGALRGREADASLRSLIIDTQRDLAELNLIGHIFTRTRKREVQTKLAQRKSYSLRVKLTPREAEFYSAVTEFVRAECERRFESGLIISWVLNMPQRRVASSIPAMVNHYRSHPALVEGDQAEDLDDDFFTLDPSPIPDYESARYRLQEIISTWPTEQVDSKYEALIGALRDLRSQEGRIKALIFSFFKDTLRYLARRLEADGFRVSLIHGDVRPVDRIGIIQHFREQPEVELLLSSRVGSEGLDFQFCDTLFNYDLPWNPMEVEQRIGRLDRIGQQSQVIRIYNFWVEGTIEGRILQRLFNRIGVFKRSIGDLEPILGEVIVSLEREVLSRHLSVEEENRILDEKLSVITRRKKDIEELERESAKFVGTDHFFDLEVEAIKERKLFVTGEQIHRFLEDFIRSRSPRTRLVYDRDAQEGILYPDEVFKTLLLEHAEPRSLGRFLSAGPRGIQITFDSQTAFDEPTREFLNLLHPVIQAIVKNYSEGSLTDSNAHHVLLRTSRLAPGIYFYFIFRLRVSAAKGQNTLQIVMLNDQLNRACPDAESEIILGEMLEHGEDSPAMAGELDRKSVHQACRTATEFFQTRVAEIKSDHERNNDKFIDRRIQSIRTHYEKLLDSQRRRLRQAEAEDKDERYLRIPRGIIRRLESEQAQKLKALESRRMVQVEYDEISAGILEVHPE